MYSEIARAAAALATILTFSISAHANNVENCTGDEVDGGLRIGACTALIRSGVLTIGDIAIVYFNRGLGYYQEGELDKAIADYSQVVKLIPESTDAFYSRGLAYYDERKFDKAFQDFEQAIKLDPTSTNAYIGRGLAYFYQGKPNAAITDYDHALQLSPNDAVAHYNRGEAYAWLNRLEHALSDFESSLLHTPESEHAEWLSDICWDLGLMARVNLALPFCKRAVSTGTEIIIHDRLAFIFWQLGEKEKARAELVTAYVLSSDTEAIEPDKRLREFSVTLAQGLLTRLAYRPGYTNGKYNPRTAAAIKAFQRDQGLEETGRVSDELIAALKAARPE